MHGYTASSVTITLGGHRRWGDSIYVPYNYVPLERLHELERRLYLKPADEPRRARGLPSYTEARFAPTAPPRAPRREAREPAVLERAAALRTDREPGRRRARSRDYARTGRCSRRPAP